MLYPLPGFPFGLQYLLNRIRPGRFHLAKSLSCNSIGIDLDHGKRSCVKENDYYILNINLSERLVILPEISFFRYADIHARVRARIGAMPDEARWHYVADASDLDNLIERMRSSGLSHWVADLPRSPNTITIEDSLRQHLLNLLKNVGRLLPGRWTGVKRWLYLASNLLWVQRLLTEADIEPPEQIDATLRPIFSLPVDERSKRLEQTPYHRYLSTSSPFDSWLSDFSACCPAVSGREAYVLRRLIRSVLRHRTRLLGLRKQAAVHGTVDPAAQWRLRDELSLELRGLIGGDPFHVGLVLIYCLLELLQYERCRAFLVARSCGWERPEILGSKA